MAGRLQGKVATITGAGSGIGRASAVLFAREGASLALVDRDEAGLAEAAAEVEAAGAAVLALAGDVGCEPTVARQSGDILARFGRIDVLLACAGFSNGTSVPDTTLESWEAVLRTNLTGSFLWSRVALAAMRTARSGSIILVGSQLAFAGGRSNAAYLASKGAVVSLAQSMAVDHAPENIRVNVLVPGAIDTALLRRSFKRSGDPEGSHARSVARHPLGRLGQADEVARAALFLASDESSFTTGACLRVDGGWLAG